MRVSDWIRRQPGKAITVSPDVSLEKLLDRLLSEPCLRDLYVVEADRVVGHISHRRIAHLLLARHRPVHTRRELMDRVVAASAREVMRSGFPTARPHEDLDSVLGRLLEHDVEDMPVIDEEGRLLGAINLSEVLRAVRRGELD